MSLLERTDVPVPDFAAVVSERREDDAAVLQRERACVGDFQRITGIERDPVRRQCAARNVHVQASIIVDFDHCIFRPIEETGIDPRVLMNQHRFLRAIRRSDQTQTAALIVRTEALLFVAGVDTLHVRLYPNLQEMDDLIG